MDMEPWRTSKPPWQESKPSPYCGRVDAHDPHPWTRHGKTYECPGPPHGTYPYARPS